MQPKYEMMRKILTYKVEYADFGGEENFTKEEDVLAETFSEGERILAQYLEGRQYHIISVCWKKFAIGEPPNTACTGLASPVPSDNDSAQPASQ